MNSNATLTTRLARHPFLQGLDQHQIEVLAQAAIPTHFQPGETIFSAGEPANGFYLLESGTIVLETAQQDAAPIVIDTIHAGEPLGWSWMFPPYLWQFNARAIEPGSALCLAAIALRQHRAEDLTLSHELFQRMSRAMVRRLHAAREKLAAAKRGQRQG